MAEHNQFKKLFEAENLPPEHKKEFLRTLETVKLFGDIIDMFSIKQARVDSSLLDQLQNKRRDDYPDRKGDMPD